MKRSDKVASSVQPFAGICAAPVAFSLRVNFVEVKELIVDVQLANENDGGRRQRGRTRSKVHFRYVPK